MPKGMGFSNFERCGQIVLQVLGQLWVLSKAVVPLVL